MKKVIYTVLMIMTVLSVKAHVGTELSETIEKSSVLISDETSYQNSELFTSLTSPEQPKQRFLPTNRRMNREINKMAFAYKGEVLMGVTASYGTLSKDNSDILLVVSNIDTDGVIASVKPYISYFYRDNRCIGVRLGYNHISGNLDVANIDLGPSNDITAAIPYIGTTSDNYSLGLFHRAYVGLDPRGRFGLFAEVELEASMGTSQFGYETDGVIKRTYSDNMQFRFSFNPGVAIYIFPNVCGTLSFGLGGVKYTHVNQKDEAGNKVGSRSSSSMNFKLNIAAINIGLTIHLWDKKDKKRR